MNHKTTEKKHIECYVCGKGFNSAYDEELHFYPVYHPKANATDFNACEVKFYKTLMNVYRHLHECDLTLQIPELLSRVDFSEIMLKRETILWCSDRGFLTFDSLKRIMIPPAINEISKDFFQSDSLDNPESVAKAMDYIKSAYRVLKDELAKWRPKIEEEEAPEEEEKRPLHRMFTADMTSEKKTAGAERRERAPGMYSR